MIANKKTMRTFVITAFLGSAAFSANLASAAEDPYKFMPKGGREILLDVLGRCANCDNIANIVTSQRTQEEWSRYFFGKQTGVKQGSGDKKTGALANLAENQAKTLVSYLATNMPIPKNSLPKGANKTDWKSFLPPDGRQLTLEKCMGCHSIAATMLNEADSRGWDMILRKSDHRVIKMTDKEAQTLKQYLSINTPVPEGEIPAELKQSSGVY